MMRVVPPVGRDDFALGALQCVECLLGMSTKLEPPVGGLGLLNVMNRVFGGAVCIPQIGMMDFIGQGDGCCEKGSQRSNESLFHDSPLR